MAEFRKLFYALGVAAMLATTVNTAEAKPKCDLVDSKGSAATIVKADTFADLVGDYYLQCVGGATAPSAVGKLLTIRGVKSLVLVGMPADTAVLSVGIAAKQWTDPAAPFKIATIKVIPMLFNGISVALPVATPLGMARTHSIDVQAGFQYYQASASTLVPAGFQYSHAIAPSLTKQYPEPLQAQNGQHGAQFARINYASGGSVKQSTAALNGYPSMAPQNRLVLHW